MQEISENNSEKRVVNSLSELVGRYLSFKLSRETYGINILQVVEIISLIDITPVPNSASYVKGIVNIRGQIIPIVDLRLKLAMPEAEATKETCIIVVTVAMEGGDISIGLLVDSVREVVDIDQNNLAEAPKYGASLETSFLSAMAKMDDGAVVILLDVEKALRNDTAELAGMDKQ